MAEIKRVYRQSLPAMRFVGRRYGEEDKQNNTFSHIWTEWFANNLFAPLTVENAAEEPFEDCRAFYGLSGCKSDGTYDYYIGAFLPADAAVPEGYTSLDFDAGEMAVCWVYGREPDIYFHCCLSRLQEEGLQWAPDKNGVRWCCERYVSPRFTQPDKDGCVILDMCYFI